MAARQRQEDTTADDRIELVSLPVADAERAKAFYGGNLLARGVAASEVDEQPWGRFVRFADPDGNTWSVQELPAWSG